MLEVGATSPRADLSISAILQQLSNRARALQADILGFPQPNLFVMRSDIRREPKTFLRISDLRFSAATSLKGRRLSPHGWIDSPEQVIELVCTRSGKAEAAMSRTIHTVVFKDGDIFVASGVELDVAAQGKTEAEAMARLDLVLNAEIRQAAESGRDVFDLGPAPESILRRFKSDDNVATHERLVA